jgi:hypothetical protein
MGFKAIARGPIGVAREGVMVEEPDATNAAATAGRVVRLDQRITPEAFDLHGFLPSPDLRD